MSIKNSCKLAGAIDPKMSCEPCKIKLIFRGAESDPFINEMKGSISLEDTALDVQKGFAKQSLEGTNALGSLSWESTGSSEGFVYALTKEYTKGTYFFKIQGKGSSLYFMKDFYMLCSKGEGKRLRIVDGLVGISSNQFQDKYLHQEGGQNYLYIVVEIGLNIAINCELEGASESLIHQKSDRKSLIVPLDYKSGYYDIDFLKYPKYVVSRADNKFDHFLDENDDSIGVKTVNYRKDIYTGDENNRLTGDAYFYNIPLAGKPIAFKTGVSPKYYHAEYIESKVFVMLECNGQQYLLDKHKFKLIKNKLTKTIQDLKINEDKYLYHIQHKSIQLIFVHLKFDGQTLSHKDIIIDSTKFDETGNPKL
ncbi:MAG TPA: hypothetical protein EYG75_05665 [Campylobacterales bacterium]|nr:hypothetical protein [Campylobacterales bacterium]